MLIKIIHMSAGLLVIILFYVQAVMLLQRRRAAQAFPVHSVQPITGLAKGLKMALHICWTIVIVAGLYLLANLPGIYPYWLMAKIGLFVLAIVFSIFSFRGKGSKRRQNISLIGAAICYALILFLVIVKPWGYVLTGHANQPVSGSASEALVHPN
ncbi:MAG: SirB2 family protein [Candidatus Saccharibacteria bacterium]|nr:SirB2 family protein [Moraxellaceae bacterium]